MNSEEEVAVVVVAHEIPTSDHNDDDDDDEEDDEDDNNNIYSTRLHSTAAIGNTVDYDYHQYQGASYHQYCHHPTAPMPMMLPPIPPPPPPPLSDSSNSNNNNNNNNEQQLDYTRQYYEARMREHAMQYANAAAGAAWAAACMANTVGTAAGPYYPPIPIPPLGSSGGGGGHHYHTMTMAHPHNNMYPQFHPPSEYQTPRRQCCK